MSKSQSLIISPFGISVLFSLDKSPRGIHKFNRVIQVSVSIKFSISDILSAKNPIIPFVYSKYNFF
ncbi:TPA: hypothetical protein DEG21_01800 [Patescibacteria group bacterium]|nr:hypothetical protein [Candidatus Gracilibacteria bacterium]HBY74621.1 hypothetical protein [Candidatus Gracilibacteria bacterium]